VLKVQVTVTEVPDCRSLQVVPSSQFSVWALALDYRELRTGNWSWRWSII